MRRILFVVASFGLMTLSTPLNAADESNGYVPLEPGVSTVAGSGQFGVADGAALSASFLEPAGIAVARDGTIYVTDIGAQDVREIKNGVVQTVAGIAAPAKILAQRDGGYQDGPAATARFSRPSGIAVGADGALYVADEGNRSIRKIFHGVVTTYAGQPRNGPKDGPRGEGGGGFQYPRGIAIDDDGNLYVADFEMGIKKVTTDGTITTLNVPSDTGVSSVAVKGAGANLILAYVDRKAVHLVAGGKNLEAPFDHEREPNAQNYIVGKAFGVALLSNRTVAVTDLQSNAVRFLRFPDAGISQVMTRTLAGGLREGTVPVGGYRDGPSDRAMVDIPYGIAVAPNGTVFFTDAGNRRIRKVDNLDARTGYGGELPAAPPPGSYRIALVGASYMFLNTLWPESFAGPIEVELRRHGAELGLRKPVNVQMERVDGTGFSDQRNLIASYYGDGQADLVVWFVSTHEIGHELETHPDLNVAGKWKAVVPSELRDTAATLAKQHTRLLVVVIPQGEEVSPLERAPRLEETAGQAYHTAELSVNAANLENVFAASGVRTLKLLGLMQAFENRPDRYPLYNTWDYHLSTEGSTWVGTEVAADLLRWKPWSASP